MLRTIKRSPDCPFAEKLADRCFSLYEQFGMPVHPITFAQGMPEVPRPYGVNTDKMSSKWNQKLESQERRRALWQEAVDLVQVMLRAYLESVRFMLTCSENGFTAALTLPTTEICAYRIASYTGRGLERFCTSIWLNE
jgi:hypothetical protein